MIMTHAQAVEEYGSPYRINKEIESNRLFRLARGFYSKNRHEDPYALATMRYPDAIVTMDSAFWLHGLTDVIPDRVHLATPRDSTRISDAGIVQHFSEDRLLLPGKTSIVREGNDIPIYDKERMLVELMRNSASLPFDHYKEIMSSYRKIADELDIRAIEDYISLFERNDYLYDALQREVM